ncbi:hypothetical protein ACIPPQ_21685 [Sphingopyxis sp. LARHCG72]
MSILDFVNEVPKTEPDRVITKPVSSPEHTDVAIRRKWRHEPWSIYFRAFVMRPDSPRAAVAPFAAGPVRMGSATFFSKNPLLCFLAVHDRVCAASSD